MSTLSIAAGELMRLDFCSPCWAQDRGAAAIELAREERLAAAAEAAAEAALAAAGDPDVAAPAESIQGHSEEEALPREDLFWWSTRHEVDKKRSLQLDMASLERLFLELEGRPEPRLRELRYVLCLLLMRKRRVKVVKVERGPEGESFLVRRPRREESLRVFVFDFDAARMDELRADLQAIFDGAEEEGEIRLPDPPEPGSEPEEVVAEMGDDDEIGEEGEASGATDGGPVEESPEGSVDETPGETPGETPDEELEPTSGGR